MTALEEEETKNAVRTTQQPPSGRVDEVRQGLLRLVHFRITMHGCACRVRIRCSMHYTFSDFWWPLNRVEVGLVIIRVLNIAVVRR